MFWTGSKIKNSFGKSFIKPNPMKVNTQKQVKESWTDTSRALVFSTEES